MLIDNRKESISILVKPTHDCNFDCEYCYEKPIREKCRNIKMSFSTIDKILNIVSKYSKRAFWIWHGGEPTLMGTEWYKKVQELFYKYDDICKIEQSMQSNGSLLNKDWANLSNNYGIQIGVSYDGEGQDIRSRNTNYNVKNSILKYESSGGFCGGIAVINKENFKKQIDIYNKYKNELKMSCSFNHVFQTEGTKKYNLKMETKEFVDEYIKFLKYWIFDGTNEAISERSTLVILGLIFGITNKICSFTDCRKNWLGFNANGDIYPCDRALPERYKLGNIKDINSIEEIYNSNGFRLYFSEIEKRFNTHCKQCGYFEYCKGGCNASHICTSGSADGIDKFSCEILRKKFNSVYDFIRELDIYGSRINKYFMNFLIEEEVFTLNEIKNFLKSKGINTKWEYTNNGKQLFECKEFNIFRIFNPIRSVNENCHTDKIINVITKENILSGKKLEESRIEKLDKIFSKKYNLIMKTLKGCRHE